MTLDVLSFIHKFQSIGILTASITTSICRTVVHCLRRLDGGHEWSQDEQPLLADKGLRIIAWYRSEAVIFLQFADQHWCGTRVKFPTNQPHPSNLNPPD
jgi:hypothetical protein